MTRNFFFLDVFPCVLWLQVDLDVLPWVLWLASKFGCFTLSCVAVSRSTCKFRVFTYCTAKFGSVCKHRYWYLQIKIQDLIKLLPVGTYSCTKFSTGQYYRYRCKGSL